MPRTTGRRGARWGLVGNRRLTVALVVVALVLGSVLLFRLGAEIGGRIWGPRSYPGSFALAEEPPARLPPASIRSAAVLIAGDIARCGQLEAAQATAGLIERTRGLVMTAGDNAYTNGTLKQFAECYQPTWGRFRSRTYPTLGNHDYGTRNAAGYFEYFGDRAGPDGRGYYAFMAGDWRVYALDSQPCLANGCGPDSDQYAWLADALETQRHHCILAVMHHPRFSSGFHGDQREVTPLWDLLYDAGADVVVSGHDHSYERLLPMRPDGQADLLRGIRQFVVGTGGVALRPTGAHQRMTSAVTNDSSHGVLRLRLHTGSYDWEFLPVLGATFSDRGTGRCHRPHA